LIKTDTLSVANFDPERVEENDWVHWLQGPVLPVRYFSQNGISDAADKVSGHPCEAACSPSQRLHAVLTSGHRVDVVEPICSTSKAQPLNLMKVEAALAARRRHAHRITPKLVCVSLCHSLSPS
jgi:hypothetical protein